MEIENNDDIQWDWEHEFQVLESELEDTEAIFKYIIGFGSMLISHRRIEKTETPLRYRAKYVFRKR